MCQINNRFLKSDASRKTAYKVMNRLVRGDGVLYVSPWVGAAYPPGREVEAKGGSNSDFVDCDEIHAGAFHVYTRLNDALFVFAPWGSGQRVVVKVAVADYVASGTTGSGDRSACYRRMCILEEVYNEER